MSYPPPPPCVQMSDIEFGMETATKHKIGFYFNFMDPLPRCFFLPCLSLIKLRNL